MQEEGGSRQLGGMMGHEMIADSTGKGGGGIKWGYGTKGERGAAAAPPLAAAVGGESPLTPKRKAGGRERGKGAPTPPPPPPRPSRPRAGRRLEDRRPQRVGHPLQVRLDGAPHRGAAAALAAAAVLSTAAAAPAATTAASARTTTSATSSSSSSTSACTGSSGASSSGGAGAARGRGAARRRDGAHVAQRQALDQRAAVEEEEGGHGARLVEARYVRGKVVLCCCVCCCFCCCWRFGWLGWCGCACWCVVVLRTAVSLQRAACTPVLGTRHPASGPA